ncbi:hypothetical protein OIU74_019429, partial [Salix koriyanagi]
MLKGGSMYAKIFFHHDFIETKKETVLFKTTWPANHRQIHLRLLLIFILQWYGC